MVEKNRFSLIYLHILAHRQRIYYASKAASDEAGRFIGLPVPGRSPDCFYLSRRTRGGSCLQLAAVILPRVQTLADGEIGCSLYSAAVSHE